MLSIRNKEPWCFWPTRVCKEFYKLPGNAVLSGKYNFEFELDFTIRKVYEDKATIFAILPIYTALNYYNEHMSNVDVQTEDGMKWNDIKNIVKLNKRHKVNVTNIANGTITIKLDGTTVFEAEGFTNNDDPQMILGGGNFLYNDNNHNHCDLDLHEFKLSNDGELIAHHTFEDYIHDKTVDLTGNCNFIFKL